MIYSCPTATAEPNDYNI